MRTRTTSQSLLNGVKLWVLWCPAAEDRGMRRWLVTILGTSGIGSDGGSASGGGISSVGFIVSIAGGELCTLLVLAPQPT
jgi:hypothetical protein